MDESGSRSVFPPPPPTGPLPTSPPPTSPPTTRWPRPPLSDTPPRPAGFGPPSSLAGPPPPPDPEVPAAGSGGSGRGRGRTLLRAAGVGVVALSLASGGFALGTVLDDADPPTQSVDTVRPAVDVDTSNDPPGSSTLPADVAGPVDEDAAVEPVAAVAAAVNPSVVQISNSSLGQGSGIVWDAANGYIVTNDHVTSGLQTVQVRFADGSTVTGEVIGGSSAADVAVVQVDPTEISLVEAVFAPSSTVQVGQLAVAIGSPFGLDQSVTAGIVSAVRINPYGGSDPAVSVPVEMIQTDAPINAGNSGGALADRQGRVIGMNTSIRTDGLSAGNVGVGFALPSDTIVLIAGRIVSGEPLDLGYLGVSGSPETDSAGVLVTEVVPGSPAEEAGIGVGDVIVGLDGDPVREISELSAAIKLYLPGEMVEVEIERDDTTIVVSVELGRLTPN